MTSGPDETRALTRREAREIATQHAALLQASAPKKTPARRVTSLVAGLAAFGLLGGTVAGAGVAVAQSESATVESGSRFAAAASEAQVYIAAADLSHAGTIDYGSYEVYVTPTPTPTPTRTAEPAEAGEDAEVPGGGTETWTPSFVAPDPGSAQSTALEMVTARGWGESEFSCLVALWNRESGWNVNAYNASSGAYGIPQSLPGSKMASHGADWQTNAATQIAWGLDYIANRYGAPCGAWGHSESVGWY